MVTQVPRGVVRGNWWHGLVNDVVRMNIVALALEQKRIKQLRMWHIAETGRAHFSKKVSTPAETRWTHPSQRPLCIQETMQHKTEAKTDVRGVLGMFVASRRI